MLNYRPSVHNASANVNSSNNSFGYHLTQNPENQFYLNKKLNEYSTGTNENLI